MLRTTAVRPVQSSKVWKTFKDWGVAAGVSVWEKSKKGRNNLVVTTWNGIQYSVNIREILKEYQVENITSCGVNSSQLVPLA